MSSLDVGAITSPYFDWEDTSSVNLRGYGDVTLPWYSGAAVSIPSFVLDDYKNTDGWDMIYNFCDDPTNTHQGQYYLMFYNKFTGILRVFFHNIYNTTQGSMTMWRFYINGANALLNTSGHFTHPMNIKQNQQIYVNNYSTVPARSLTRGWNCFDVELCYDRDVESKSLQMSITPYDQQIADIKLIGDVSLNSEGTIISTSSSNPVKDFTNSAAKEAGASAKKKIEDMVRNGQIKVKSNVANVIQDIANNGVKAIVNNGLNLIFGSFIGRFNTTNTTRQDINFKTTGRIHTTGTISSVLQSNVPAIANIMIPGTVKTGADSYLPSYSNSLGVWNLEKEPVIIMSDEEIYEELRDYQFGDPDELFEPVGYRYHRRWYLDKNSIKVAINPHTLANVSKYEVESEILNYKHFDEAWQYKYGESSLVSVLGDVVYTAKDTVRIVGDKPEINTILFLKNCTIDPSSDYLYPKGGSQVKYINNGRTKLWVNTGARVFNSDFVIKVTLKLYPKAPYNQDPIILTRTYSPKYQIVSGLLNWQYL